MQPSRKPLCSLTGFRHITLAATMATALGLSLHAHAQLPPVQMHGSTEYVSGGFGLDESTALSRARSR